MKIAKLIFVAAALQFFCLTGFSQSTKSISLAGEWSFSLDPKDIGIKENWPAKQLPTTIQLPGTTATNSLGDVPVTADRGQLTPAYRYIGPAWYQRTVDIPTGWSGKQTVLFLERVLIRSTVWIDGKQIGTPIDFLGVPHQHQLGSLTAGKHTITVRVDNRNVLNAGLGSGHHYYDGMQTIWNGLIGRLELIAAPTVSLDLVRLFPSYKNGTVGIETTIFNGTGIVVNRKLRVIIREKASQKQVAQAEYKIQTNAGKSTNRQELKLAKQPLPWDEFQPNLYQVEVTLGTSAQADTYHTEIGFRDLGADEYHLTINERPMFYRNNHDGCIFPLTGYPPTDVESWKHILRIYKSHGLNGIRFHSWTPPDAAFTAADELGIYIQSEHFWNRMDATPEMATFAKQEMRACLDWYGNHPSNCYVLYGNELGGDLKLYGDWLKKDRAYDPRHLYSVAAGRRVNGDDFSEYGAKMNWQAPFTDWDYSGYFKASHLNHLPETTHELGQPVTHPNWQELAKYTGVLKPRNYEKFREAARQAGVEAQSAEFQKASGNINRINYKYDIEALLRTPQSAGYNLLDMHDYPGQGEALVGWLDAFYEEKGFLTAKEFSHYGSATVPLTRLPRFVFTDGETLTVKAELAHYGAAALPKAKLCWILRDDAKNIFASGKLAPVDVPVGSVTRLGEIACPLSSSSPHGMHLVLEFTIVGTPYANSWDLWVFPKADTKPEPKDVFITDDATAAVKALDAGGKVLLLANRLGKGSKHGALACFKPPFWSTNYSFGQQSNVLGAIVRNQHPALALFPTNDVLDWQWQPLCADASEYVEKPDNSWADLPLIINPNGRGFMLDGFPADYRPIVQPVPDFQRPIKIGTIFEVKTQRGGQLMVCGYDINNQLDTRPVARQLRKSLLTYMASERFTPDYAVGNDWILSTFENADKPLVMPTGFEKAYLYIKAGGKHPMGAGNASWNEKCDAVVRTDDKMQYTVNNATVWADEGGTAWAGSKIRIQINVKEAIGGILKVRFHDWNHAGRRGIVRSEDGQQQQLGPHENGLWLEFPLRREDSLDGVIMLEADVTSGPNLMITDIAIVPR
jgi:beta-galactosidase